MKITDGNCPHCKQPYTEDNRRVHYKTEQRCEGCHPNNANAAFEEGNENLRSNPTFGEDP